MSSMPDGDDPSTQSSGVAVCLRCNRAFPKDKMRPLPKWMAVLFDIVSTGAVSEETGQDSLYCDACRGRVVFAAHLFVAVFAGVAILFVAAKAFGAAA